MKKIAVYGFYALLMAPGIGLALYALYLAIEEERRAGMNMDDTIRKAIFHLTTAGEVKWNDFSFVGIDDSYTTWYYAEKEQYILWDAVTDGYYFIKARSPIEALYKYKCRWDEAMKAGLCQEEEEW